MAGLQDILEGWISGKIEPPPVTQLVGIRLVACEPGHAEVEMVAGRQHHNPMGIVHGGILCDLADAAMGIALASSLSEGDTFTTLELHINYFRPIQEGKLTAHGRTVRRGRSTGFVECEILDAEGKLIAKASSCCLIQAVK